MTTPRTAEEAIELLRQDTRIELLVTDMTLPGRMTGLDLVHKARELLPDLKILTISGSTSDLSVKTLHLDCLAFLPSRFARAISTGPPFRYVPLFGDATNADA
jgi:CheY-like chemotaxis protein